MSVLWRREDGGRIIEVRSARATRRLYVDGVLHTSHSPVRPLTGAVWDHLALSALLARPNGVRRVLVLGLGGGAVVHLLRLHVAPQRITAVELDPVLVDVAQTWFDVGGPDLELVTADALAWVRRNTRRRFDLIVDDLFGESGGEPVRAAGDDEGWWPRLASMLAPGGVLAVNFAELRDLTSSALCQDVTLRRTFPVALRFSCPHYDNAAAAFCRAPASAGALRRRIDATPSLSTAQARKLLRFRVHRLWPV